MSATAAPAEPGTRTPYRLKLHQIECCNCEVACGCQFGIGPLPGFCEFLIGYRVIAGRVGETAMDGLAFVIACKYPGAIHQGHGEVVCFVDDQATPAQLEALMTVLSGKAGGMPWEALAGTVEKFTGPVLKPIEMTVNGTRSGYRIPGILEVRQQPVKDPVSGEEKDMHIVYPKGGFFWDDGSVCTTAAMQVNYGGLTFHHEGRYACYAEANWTNQT